MKITNAKMNNVFQRSETTCVKYSIYSSLFETYFKNTTYSKQKIVLNVSTQPIGHAALQSVKRGANMRSASLLDKSRMRKIFRKLLHKRRRRLIFHSGGNIPGLLGCASPTPFKN